MKKKKKKKKKKTGDDAPEAEPAPEEPTPEAPEPTKEEPVEVRLKSVHVLQNYGVDRTDRGNICQ